MGRERRREREGGTKTCLFSCTSALSMNTMSGCDYHGETCALSATSRAETFAEHKPTLVIQA